MSVREQMSREQIIAAAHINTVLGIAEITVIDNTEHQQLGQPVDDSQGPCVACGATHTRYGQHGNPLCPDCK